MKKARAAYREPKLPTNLQPRWETPNPRGVKGSYGPEVVLWAEREVGLVFRPWLDVVRGHDAWSADVMGNEREADRRDRHSTDPNVPNGEAGPTIDNSQLDG